ncbi:mitochondrial ribosomal protein subunit L20-domain-containing protein [Trametes polyzona]|nr:mitochondrial ribosomal protein subunit L20-domain-containing protein [Trametes polyzona]
MKPRLPFSLRLPLTRSYATRLPERPPYRAPDPLVNNPHAVYQELSDANATFIHRPPPTAPSPLSYTTSPASPLLKDGPTPVTGELPPVVGRTVPQQARVSDEDIAKIRQLRREDPEKWTRTRLAKEFNCTPWFVSKVSSLTAAQRRQALQKREAEHAAAREKWGERKSLQQEVRKKRKEFW